MPEQQIKDFIARRVPVEIYHTHENGSWLWAVQVAGTNFWLDAHRTVEKSIKYCSKNQLPYKILDKVHH
jgi:hypothetical protein